MTTLKNLTSFFKNRIAIEEKTGHTEKSAIEFYNELLQAYGFNEKNCLKAATEIAEFALKLNKIHPNDSWV